MAEERGHERAQAVQTSLSAEAGDDNVLSTTFHVPIDERDEEHEITTALEPARDIQHKGTIKSTFTLRTHDGDGYVLPFLPWETTKVHLKQIYELKGRERLAEAVENNDFSMLTENGDIILPALWEAVVNPSSELMIVQVRISRDILHPDIELIRSDKDEFRGRHQSYSPPRDIFNRDKAIQIMFSEKPSDITVRHKATESTTRDLKNALSADEDSSGWTDQESSAGDSSSDSELSISDSELSVTASSVDIEVELLRTTLDAMDEEGNKLSFQVNTTFTEPPDRASIQTKDTPKKRGPQELMGEEYMSITKAVSTQTENRNLLQVYVLPGPRGTPEHPDVSVRWYHLHSQRLDFTQFKETCLNITGSSARLHKLTKKLLERVEKDKLKAFLGGMFIEPGTVLRADESDRSDPLSVIFSCIPYFDLQAASRETAMSDQVDRLFPVRTLLQSYYPYEPVRDRDAEQAYRKFGNKRPVALIHVPNLWMANIGPNIVITCGHQSLSEGFVESIEVVDAKQHRTSVKQAEEHRDINVRLTDWNGRRLLYTVEEVRSYFQMEQKLKELRQRSDHVGSERSLKPVWHTQDCNVNATPGLWTRIIGQKDNLFIDISVSDNNKETNKDASLLGLPSVPFFHWPQKSEAGKDQSSGIIPAKINLSMQCLEHVEKAMLSQVLSSCDTHSAVEKTFTSTTYYRSLQENTAEDVKSSVKTLLTAHGKLATSTASNPSIHQVVVSHQHAAAAQRTSELYNVMHSTISLFVADVDKSTLLRRSWGAMSSICSIATKMCNRAAIRSDPEEYTDPNWSHSSMSHRGWVVRLTFDQSKDPAIVKTFTTELKRCRKCRSLKMYASAQGALLHLQKHMRRVDASVSSALTPKRWIVNYAQLKMELWMEGVVAILKTACKIAQKLLSQMKELAHGVLEEDGKISKLYTFPRALLSTFRQLLVFYFAVERALHFTEEAYQDKVNAFEDLEYMTTIPFSSQGLHVLKAFGNGAQQALVTARNELCFMVKSTGSEDIYKRLSLSPEYMCSWFMRRLIVKPLERSMTVSDMYREYLSTIQFQVNHRPGKRLLRSINLLQEELVALQEVNTQQSKLISNYTNVLNDDTYDKDVPSRRAMFPYERMLLESCQDSLQMTDQEYRYLIARCGPLSDSTKQSLEINEEDHGKAIMVFTIVTIIFLPLSFVTSFLGMNTTDIRDMGSSSWLFWAIALPLTAVTMGSILYIGYNGDELRDTLSSLYRTVTGKQNRSTTARGISVAQRQRARKLPSSSDSNVDFKSLADEAEYANPRPGDCNRTTRRTEVDDWYAAEPRVPRRQYTLEPPTMQWEPYIRGANPPPPPPPRERYSGLRTQKTEVPLGDLQLESFPPQTYTTRRYRVYDQPPQRTEYIIPPATGRHARGSIDTASFESLESPQEPITGRGRRRRDRDRSREREAEPYEWTRKSHRHEHGGRDGNRRRGTKRMDSDPWEC